MEVLEPEPQLVLFGAGHVALPTARFAEAVGFRLTVIDDRADFNTQERFPNAERILSEPSEAIRDAALNWGGNPYVVICTRSHALDAETLALCVQKPLKYLGMIGSRRKVAKTFERIRQTHPEADLDSVHAPIGLDIGAQTPVEIGLAIVAQLVETRRGKRWSEDAQSATSDTALTVPD